MYIRPIVSRWTLFCDLQALRMTLLFYSIIFCTWATENCVNFYYDASIVKLNVCRVANYDIMSIIALACTLLESFVNF